MTAGTRTQIEFLTWDAMAGDLAPSTVVAVLGRFAGGPIYAMTIDAGTDDCIVALSNQPVSATEAMAAWISS